MKAVIPPVKGTRDFYPPQMAVRTWLYQTVRRVSESFGYQEYEAPILEPLALYAAKSGEELVKKQSYVFTDRGGDEITLRPELTPSLARMVAQKQGELVFPLRWWSFGPFWRYEKMQRGRSREFFQWNIDMLGVNSPEADAELVAIAAEFLRTVGLTPAQARIFVNNRRLMEAEFERLGIPPEKRGEVATLVDRRSKMEAAEWEEYATEIGLSGAQLNGLKSLLANEALWQQSEELTRLFEVLRALDVADYVQFDPNIMRGLLYYTGTVFEAFDITGGVRRAILGGGRYDNLLADVGGDPLSGVGFAMGDVVIGIILSELGLIPPLRVQPASVLVTVFSSELLPETLRLAAELRRSGLFVATYPESAKLPKQFKYADRLGMQAVLVLGPDELATGQVTVKDLKRGQQVTVSRTEVYAVVMKILTEA
ncbi:MAG: histidine--tRNA ligase [Anaerolineales bacterium]|nr:histidine--tRNA ligase [Anaerolineales bacterium]MCX7608447.1 histidine--tRNA ligase [Anaerolineales bacterium]MDW8228183.1 histidine--tRNA ligase [Anaerolineales bacterium]